jgi:hypothetical protein
MENNRQNVQKTLEPAEIPDWLNTFIPKKH